MLRRGLFTVLCAVSRALERAARLVGYAAAGTAQLDDIRRGVHAEGEGADAAAWESYVTSGLTWWERDFYLRHLDPRDRILVVGCGAGRELLALRQEGYRADGLDVAPRCTTLAREVLAARGLTAEIYTGAIEETTLPARFDAVIFSIWLYSHIPHAELRIETLRKVRAQLAPGGKILISYAVHEGLARRSPSDWHASSRGGAARTGGLRTATSCPSTAAANTSFASSIALRPGPSSGRRRRPA